MLAIVIPTIVFAVGVTWWFREGNPRAKRQPDFVYSGRVEIVMWMVSLLTVLFLSGLKWTSSHDLDPYKRLPETNGRTIEVQVVALDWKWLFIYPEQGVADAHSARHRHAHPRLRRRDDDAGATGGCLPLWRLPAARALRPDLLRHDTIMIFFGAMPFMIGLINFVVPLQLGVCDVAFPCSTRRRSS